MFRGGSTVKLDAKGRLALPTRYRPLITERFEGRLVVTVHHDGCLLLYPQPQWEEIEHRLINTANQDRRVRDMQRMLLGYATEVEMDGNGRILLAPRLRDFAKLDKNVAKTHFSDPKLYMGFAHAGGRGYARNHLVVPGNNDYLQSAESYIDDEK